MLTTFREGLYGDPLRPETMRKGHHLIIASAVCAAVVLFKVRLQSTSLVPLDFGNRVDVLPMLLGPAEFGVLPPTFAVVGRHNIPQAAGRLGFPLILKHNRAGKGLGVRLFLSAAALDEYLAGGAFEEPIDGITLVQRYIKAPAPFITRVEFVGGQFLYAVQVDTSEGFELCPADACRIDAADASGVCPAQAPGDKFRILRDFNHPLLPRWQAFLAANDIGIAGIEFIVDEAGRPFTYDINTNTNYNPDAEAKDGRSGMGAVAGYLGGLLARARQPQVRRTA